MTEHTELSEEYRCKLRLSKEELKRDVQFARAMEFYLKPLAKREGDESDCVQPALDP